MESIKSNQISINIPNYSGPLEVLLDSAKNQKVDLDSIIDGAIKLSAGKKKHALVKLI